MIVLHFIENLSMLDDLRNSPGVLGVASHVVVSGDVHSVQPLHKIHELFGMHV